MRQIFNIIFLGFLLTVKSAAFAAPPKGAVYLDASQMFQTTHKGKTYTCGNLSPWTPGRVVQGLFYATKREIRNIDSKLKKRLSSVQRGKLLNTRAQRKKYLTAGKPLCTTGPGAGGYFDSYGDVTAAGKAYFQIPTYLQANVLRGIGAWNANCNGCHQSSVVGLPMKKYPDLYNRIQLPPMSFLVPSEVSEQEIADITAAANF